MIEKIYNWWKIFNGLDILCLKTKQDIWISQMRVVLRAKRSSSILTSCCLWLWNIIVQMFGNLLKSRRTAREAYQERIQWVTQRCANSLWDSEEHSRGQDSSNAPVWRDAKPNTAEANLRQIQEHDKLYPSLPGFDNPVVQNSDPDQEAGQGATEVAHIPGALYQNIAMV